MQKTTIITTDAEEANSDVEEEQDVYVVAPAVKDEIDRKISEVLDSLPKLHRSPYR